MSARNVSSLGDDRRNLQQKQIGCMNGILHLFERHHFRRLSRHNNKRLLAGANNNVESEARLESPFSGQSKSQKAPEAIAAKQRDLRGAVMDSMYREARSISIKTVAKTEGRVHVVKRVDSPRPSQSDVGLMRPQERHRFSYDGRESGDTLKKAVKLKELPRLSLDSRVRSIQASASESRSNFLLGNLHGESADSLHKRSSSVVAKLMGLEDRVFAEPGMKTNDSFLPRLEPANSAMKTRSKEAPFSVYSEIEKRITELEFQKSGKDLRALKQIVEAMHRRGSRVETEKQAQATAHVCHSPRRPESSLLIMKPAKLNVKIRPGSSPIRNREDSLAPRKIDFLKDSNQHLSKGKKKNNGRSPSQNLGAVSPRLQEKSHGMEKKSHLPPPELSRVRRHQTKQTKESGLQNRRYKLKSSNLQRGKDYKCEISSETRNISDQGDTALVQSESDNEVTSKYQSKQQRICKEIDSSMRLSEDTPIAELQTAAKEQQSPVSVLDAKFYIEDSPSPVKKISTAFRDYDDADDHEVDWHTQEFEHSEINHEKFENVEIMLHNLRLNNSTGCEDTMDQIELFCQGNDADHGYVNKILLASGILRDVDRAWLHSTGHPINPKLFDVLEQTEESSQLMCRLSQLKVDQKSHRRVVFDTVNEIIVQKLSPEGFLLQGRRCLSGHQLLKEVHTEMDYLRPNLKDTEKDELVSIINVDMKHESSEDWVESQCEIPALVVDIERLIFKDLLTELISDEAARMHDRSRGHCRQLFKK